MSGVYAYCVVRSDNRPPGDLRGVCDHAVRALDLDGLSVWISDVDAPPTADLETIVRHDGVVRAASTSAAAPLRFGAWARDEATLRRRVDQNRASLEATLREVAGCVEMGIRVVRRPGEAGDADDSATGPADAGASRGSGRAYLREVAAAHASRRRRRDAQDAVVREVAERLAPLCLAARVTYLEAPGVVALAHLVRRSDEKDYRRAVEVVAQAIGGALDLHLTGPWPPYSFTS